MAEFRLQPDRVLVPRWEGTGVQFNAHAYAPQSGLSEAQFPDLERKVHALSPQLVRIFYNHKHHGDPSHPARQTKQQKDRWRSLVRTAQLAQKANATINVTWQSIVVGGKTAQQIKRTRTQKVGQFADVLDRLATDPELPITNLRWATIQNEPNTPPKGAATESRQVTPQTVCDTYRELHELLKEKGLREQIGLMGGDLIEGSGKVTSPYNHGAWFRFISDNYADILDAYSVHIYWWYDRPQRFRHRLDDVQKILEPLQKKRKPPKSVYVMEYGVRGFDIKTPKNPDGVPRPGNFHGLKGQKVPIGQTRIAAFQQAWFLIQAALQGYTGVLKWDCYYGMYDTAPQAHYVIGNPGARGWPLYPSYHLLRMIMLTTQPGWRVLEAQTPRGHPQRVAAFAADKQLTDLTLLGLDTRGATHNGRSSERSTYEFSNLPAGKRFSLVVWNRDRGDRLVVDSTHTPKAGGRATITVPVHSVFALTTKDLPEL